ncbi:EthD family reductase [Sphingomonas sp. UYP23]
MIKCSVFYPFDAAKTFDHDYYRTNHMPMVKRLLGAACYHYEIDRGAADGRIPGAPPTYICVGHFFSESIGAYQQAIAPHRDDILADIPKYTTIVPFTQFSEVVQI